MRYGFRVAACLSRTSGPRRYVQLAEAYRGGDGRPKQCTVATLGRPDQLNSDLESVIAGLLRVTGKILPEALPSPTLIFRRTRHNIDVEALLRVMVLNRLCAPDSKLGVLRWVETIALPGDMAEAIEHQHLLRAFDAMVEHQEEVDQVLASLLRPLVAQDLAVVFYDMTTIRAAGLSQQNDDVRTSGRGARWPNCVAFSTTASP